MKLMFIVTGAKCSGKTSAIKEVSKLIGSCLFECHTMDEEGPLEDFPQDEYLKRLERFIDSAIESQNSYILGGILSHDHFENFVEKIKGKITPIFILLDPKESVLRSRLGNTELNINQVEAEVSFSKYLRDRLGRCYYTVNTSIQDEVTTAKTIYLIAKKEYGLL